MFKNDKNKLIIIGVVVASLACICAYFIIENNNSEYEIYNSEFEKIEMGKEVASNEETISENKIIVHIDGAVNNPGIVTLNENSRLLDAIEQAGGLTQEADIRKINLASYLEDGMKVYIASKKGQDDVVDNAEIMYSNANDTNIDVNRDKINCNAKINNDNEKINNKNEINNGKQKININNANIEELKSLPGVGDGTASKIIEYRNKNGKFKKIEDIKEVKGIGNNKYKKIKDYISIK